MDDTGQTRYGHTNRSGGDQDQGERKDDGWKSRQGGRQSHEPGRRRGRDQQAAGRDRGGKPGGSNTQGDLKGISEAAQRVAAEEDGLVSETGEEREVRTLEDERLGDPRVSEGTPEHPRHARMPEGEQNPGNRGSGARGFDVGVDAGQVGAPYQGARPEDPSKAGRARGS
jgi:hypothetical protein